MWTNDLFAYTLLPKLTAYTRSICTVALSLAVVTTGCSEPDDHDDHDALEAEAFNEAFEELQQGKADGNSCSGVTTPDSGGFNNRVALTFDDGPNPNTTPQVLDTLAAEGIRATFFINGNRVNNATRPILQRIVNEGHILANHSQRHWNLSVQNLSTVRSEVNGTHQIIWDYATPTYFRFPYGASTCDTANIVRNEFGLNVTGWNVDSGDWCFAQDNGYCPESRFRHVPDHFRNDMPGWTMQQVRNRGGGIVLFHDIHQYTANVLPSVISQMRSEGFTFTNLDDTSVFPLLNGFSPGVSDPCANANAGSGYYCGRGIGGAENVLYECNSAGSTVATHVSDCSVCVSCPAGSNDYCEGGFVPPFACEPEIDPCNNAGSGSGYYCGQGIGGVDNVLYECSAGGDTVRTHVSDCPSCVACSPGFNDYCEGGIVPQFSCRP